MIELQSVWGWEPALYLFLGGLGAGTFAVASVVFLIGGMKRKKMMAASAWVSVFCLAVGLLLLIIELEAPLRGLMLWQSFSHFTSWMTFGAWVVFAGIVCMGLTALLLTGRVYDIACKKWKGLVKSRDKVVRMLSIAGALLGLGIAVYTGLLLMSAPGVPLWNTWLLPCLFTVSALDTGVALVVIILAATKEGSARTSKNLEKAVLSLILLEIVVLVSFVAVMLDGNSAAAGFAVPSLGSDLTEQMQASEVLFKQTAASSVQVLLEGDLAVWFWVLFVGLGLMVPLVAAAISMLPRVDHEKTTPLGLAGALCALAGGCALRFLILLAGTHVDIVKGAVATLLG